MELFANKKEGVQGSQNNISPNSQNQKNQNSNNGVVDPNNELTKQITMLSRKIRINEERSMNLRKKTQMIEHNILSNHKKVLTEMRFMNEEIADLKKEIIGLKTKLATFAHELSETAKKEDFSVLERYINLWEPVNFVTRNEVERVIKDILEEKGIIKDN